MYFYTAVCPSFPPVNTGGSVASVVALPSVALGPLPLGAVGACDSGGTFPPGAGGAGGSGGHCCGRACFVEEGAASL